MRAEVGNWLVVERSALDHQRKIGHIEDVPSADGTPPFRVRWSDDDHVCLVYPGPDARVVTEDELQAIEAARAARFGNSRS